MEIKALTTTQTIPVGHGFRGGAMTDPWPAPDWQTDSTWPQTINCVTNKASAHIGQSELSIHI